ncbi:ABC transporter permease subunit [Xanthomonas sp. XNM01]|uniref:ABC transporter permease n=1 Tax=Xanthomonas sp. XNM01 TaxID=2769289 RepID=UPI00177C1D3B|nr:ABC transporter permease subunit [Xanthomonas sp. XNM01]MBD9367119.1 ABC transporter permease [Xanthomonas sp. XNM01]
MRPDWQWRLALAVAGKEFRDRLRNRWVLAVAVVFAAFALLIAYFGGAQGGDVGFRGIGVTVASLTSLAIYLVPLIALLLGFDAIVGERERGTLDLLLSLPPTRAELLLGKYAGLAGALVLATLAGFGSALLPLLGQLDIAGFRLYLAFVGSTVLLGLAFLSLAMLISVLCSERTRASGAAIATWFGFVLVFDLALLGILVASAGRGASAWAPYALLLNPADVFRILNLYGSEGLRTAFGLGTLLPDHWNNPVLLCAAMLAWIVAPLGIALWRFR